MNRSDHSVHDPQRVTVSGTLNRGRRGVLWLVGVLAGLAVLGPALRPGSMLNLDLLALPRLQVPAGIWGLGPELPRRVPYGVVLAWCSSIIGGGATVKLVFVAAVAAAVVGAARLVRTSSLATQVAAGLIYGLSPFLLTRITVGHIAVVIAVAILPWALPTLLRPSDDVPRTLLWSAALGFAGVSGGTLALVCVAVGVAADRGRRLLAVAGATLVGQLPWIVPGTAVAASGVKLTSAGEFATRVDGLLGLLGLAAGHGFWRSSSQVGGDASAGTALLGAVLLMLAVAGARRLPAPWGGRAGAVAAVGAVLVLASAVPGVRDLYTDLTRTPLFGAGRESQRWLSLALVWLAPAAALGAARLGGRAVQAIPIACALVLAVPGLWGAGGALHPVDIPPGWRAMAEIVHARPGPVLALPWHQYFDLRVAGGRRVLNPIPDYLGGDVLAASDPELAAGRQEEADPREAHVPALLRRLAAGRAISPDLERLGVRWVALLHEVDWRGYTALRRDEGLRPAYRDGDVELFAVRGWRGPVLTDAGRALDIDPVVAPLERLDGSDGATWHRPGAHGWLRGWRRATIGRFGTLRLPAGRGLVWFWPAATVLLADLVTLCACLRAWCACQRNRASVPSTSTAEQSNGIDGTP